MLDTDDTKTIPLAEPVDNAFVKKIHGCYAYLIFPPTPVCGDETSDTGRLGDVSTDVDVFEQGVLAQAPEPARSEEGQWVVAQWLSAAAGRLSRTLMTALAATQINLAKLSWEDQRTVALDFYRIVQTASQLRNIRVSVSPDLRKRRSEVFASSLFAPSGAYMTWLALQRDETDEQR